MNQIFWSFDWICNDNNFVTCIIKNINVTIKLNHNLEGIEVTYHKNGQKV